MRLAPYDSLTILDKGGAVGEIDFHGLHPEDLNDGKIIESCLQQAQEQELKELIIIHGHGLNRTATIPRFRNSNTGFLGQTVRRILRKHMPTELDCSATGTTTVRF